MINASRFIVPNITNNVKKETCGPFVSFSKFLFHIYYPPYFPLIWSTMVSKHTNLKVCKDSLKKSLHEEYVHFNPYLRPNFSLQIYNFFTLSVYNLHDKNVSTNLQHCQKKTVDSTLNIGSNLQSTFRFPPPLHSVELS